MNNEARIEQLVEAWAISPIMPMNDFFITPESDNYTEWAQVPGCYRIGESPDLAVTRYVGEGGHLYRVWAHSRYRLLLVQMVKVKLDDSDGSDWQRETKFRRDVEEAGAKRFKPTDG